MRFSKQCECCDQKVTAYSHNLNQPLAEAFVAMTERYFETGQPVNLSDLELDHCQLANFQKLRHFGIVSNVEGRGYFPTTNGMGFYYGRIGVLNPAGSMGNVTLPEDHPAWDSCKKPRVKIMISNLLTFQYKQREEYKAERSDQSTIFDAGRQP